MRNFKSLICIYIILLLISCDIGGNDDVCISRQGAFVTAIDAPLTATVNQPVDVEVSFPVVNGCGIFNRFIETTDGNTITIAVEALYDGCFCTADVPTRTTTYSFTPNTAGDYELKFVSSNGNFIVASIEVN
jgi:hypothetical protein